jgi:tetratricopeptide (TPR) repeat protein
LLSAARRVRRRWAVRATRQQPLRGLLQLAEQRSQEADWPAAVAAWEQVVVGGTGGGCAAPPRASRQLRHARLRLAAQRREEGAIAEAERLVQQVLTEDENDPWALLESAQVSGARRDWAASVDRLEHLDGLVPDGDPKLGTLVSQRLRAARLQLAAQFREAGAYERAEEALILLLDTDPQDLSALLEYASVAADQGDWESALGRLERLHGLAVEEGVTPPKRATTQLRRVRLRAATDRRHAGAYDRAESLVLQVLDERPDDLWALTEHARIASDRSDWSLAVERWERLHALAATKGRELPAHAGRRLRMARLRLADSCRRTGDTSVVERLADQVLAEQPADVHGMALRAWAAVARQDWSEGVARWEEVYRAAEATGYSTRRLHRMESLIELRRAGIDLPPTLGLQLAAAYTTHHLHLEAVRILRDVWHDEASRPAACRLLVQVNERLSRYMLRDVMLRLYRERFAIDEWSEVRYVAAALEDDDLEAAGERIIAARRALGRRSNATEVELLDRELEIALRRGDDRQARTKLDELIRRVEPDSNILAFLDDLDVDPSPFLPKGDAHLGSVVDTASSKLARPAAYRFLRLHGADDEARELAHEDLFAGDARTRNAAAAYYIERCVIEGDLDAIETLRAKEGLDPENLWRRPHKLYLNALVLMGERHEAERLVIRRFERLREQGSMLQVHAEFETYCRLFGYLPELRDSFEQSLVELGDTPSLRNFRAVARPRSSGIWAECVNPTPLLRGIALPTSKVERCAELAASIPDAHPASARWLGNAFAGERCFLVANGPSINQLDLRPILGEYYFLMNRGYLHAAFRDAIIPFHITSDRAVYRDYWREINCSPSLIRFLSAGLALRSWRAESVPADVRVIPLYELWPRLGGVDHHNDPAIFHPDDAEAEPLMAPSRSVATRAAQAALYLGFDEVYVLGVDLDYSGPSTHFYGSATKEGQRLARFRQGGIGPASVNATFASVRRMFEARGKHLRNAGVGGQLHALERVDFEDLF